jgi:hypothetical protein
MVPERLESQEELAFQKSSRYCVSTSHFAAGTTEAWTDEGTTQWTTQLKPIWWEALLTWLISTSTREENSAIKVRRNRKLFCLPTS